MKMQEKYDQRVLRTWRFYPFAQSEPTTGDGARWARFTGETRPPRKGEYFLSGAFIEAYRAHADMTDARPIAEPIVLWG